MSPATAAPMFEMTIDCPSDEEDGQNEQQSRDPLKISKTL